MIINSVLDAAFHVAHDSPGGIHALAARMATSPNVLNKKVDPNTDTHHLRLDEAVKISLLTQDARILQAFAGSLSHVAIPLTDNHDDADMGLLDGFMQVIKEFGELTTAFQTAWADGAINSKELIRIKQEAQDVQSRLASFVQRIEQIAG